MTKIKRGGIRVLGVPIGSTAFKVAFAKEGVAELKRDLDIIARMPSLHCQFALVSKSIQHSVTHLLRSINGGAAEFADVASEYVSILLKCIRRWAPYTERPLRPRRLAFLPTRLGGLSLHSWRDTADEASVSGYCHAVISLP